MAGNPLYPASRLDGNQVLTHAFDEDRQRLRVDADATIVNADIDVALDATEDNVAIGDADTGDTLTVNSDGTITTRIVDETGAPFTDANYVPVGQTTHDNLNANANVQQGDIDVSVVNPLFTQTTNGSLEATQQDVLTELQSANSSLDAIESDTDLIRIAVQSIDSDFDVPLSTRATEATQLANNLELQEANDSLNDIEARLETFDTGNGPTTSNTIRTSSNITDETGAAFTDINYLPVGQSTHDNLNLNANVQQGDVDVSIVNPLFTQTTNGALESTQQSVLTELQAANSSLDNIESDADAIRIAVQSIDTDFDVALSTRASEVTQLANNSELQDINTELDSITTQLVLANSSLDAIESDADAIRIAVQSIDTDFDVALSTRATEATQLANNSELQDINTELDTITAELVAANTSLDNIEADTDLIRIATQSIDTDFDVALSTRASEVTQLANNTELQAINTELDSITAELVLANTSLDAIESDADAIRIAVQSIDADIDVTLSSRASEVTQLANNVELQAINTELNTITAELVSANNSLDNIEADVDQINAKLANDYGASAGAIRTASQIGNTTGAADFNAGATGAQTLRVTSNISDGSGTAITSTLVNGKQGLDVTLTSSGTIGDLAPVQTQLIGGRDEFGNLQPAFITKNANRLRVEAGDIAIFGAQIVLPRISLVVADFSVPLANNNIGSTVTGTGTVTQTTGRAVIATGTGATASAKAFTNLSILYSPGREVYAQLTAAFTTPTSAASNQHIGLYNTSNGFILGFTGLDFGITVRSATVDTFIPRASLNGDPLDGSANSRFTRDGTPEAINFTFLNIFRIRFGWLGAQVILFEIASPDGEWVVFHTIRQPNTSNVPSIQDPNLPVTAEVTKTASDATNLQIFTGSWDAGTVEAEKHLTDEAVKGRVYKTANLAAQTTSQAVLPVISAGRTLRMTTLLVTVSNSSLSTAGSLRIRDGASGAILVPLTIPASTNQSASGSNTNLTFIVPLRFTTSVYAQVVSGTLTYSVMFVGYEAEN